MNVLTLSQLKKFTQIFFVSPHLDDAAFSAGALVSALGGSNIPVTIINVFTSAGVSPSSTLSARAFLSQCRYDSADQLFLDRQAEDSRAFSFSPAIKIENLNFVDALWRKYNQPGQLQKLAAAVLPEAIHLYPTYRWHIASGKLHPQDQKLASRLTDKLNNYVHTPRPLFFAPLAMGGHVDHHLVRSSVEQLKYPSIYWKDFPYHLTSHPDREFINRHQLHPSRFTDRLDKKHQLISSYISQVVPVFGVAGPQIIPDEYYLPLTLK